MSQPKRNLLIETSAVLPAIRFSNNAHDAYFASEMAGHSLYTSTYVRMEVIRKWVCEAIQFAELAEHCSSVSEAFHFWSQEYGRKPKIAADIAGWLLSSHGLIRDEQVHEFAVEVALKALDILQAFDVRLESRTNNRCGCQIGGWKPDVDHRRLIRELGDFRKRFLADVIDCPVNEFLQLSNPKGRATKLLECTHVAADTKISGPLKQAAARDQISCSHCKTIGDQVVALEQPANMVLVHVDNSYDKLCKCTEHDHVKIRSAASFKPRPIGDVTTG